MHTQWSNNHTILVVLQAKYEQLMKKLKETLTEHSISPESEELNAFLFDVIKSVKHLPTHEVKQFITNMLENIKELHTKEVKHCDSLIYELELICELDLEYIMCPTDPNFYKGMRAQKEWNRKHRDISAGAIDPHEDRQKNFKYI